MNLAREVERALRAGRSLICVLSSEEQRLIRELARLCRSSNRLLLTWDHAEEFNALVGTLPNDPPARDPMTALGAIDRLIGPALVVLPDFHQCWERDARVLRKLKSVAHRLRSTRVAIVVTTPIDPLPPEITGDATVIRMPPLGLYTPPPETFDDLGGFTALKSWASMREGAFTRRARTYGLPPPRGVAIVGPPGTGKSLAARAVAGQWRVPLVPLDVDASGEAIRATLEHAGGASPSVLLIAGLDDEKRWQRIRAALRAQTVERGRPVFVIATATSTKNLPEELFRAGCLDEVFEIRAPTRAERREILEIRIRAREREPAAFELDTVADVSDGLVGAELERALTDAMYAAFHDRADPGREFTTTDILRALRGRPVIDKRLYASNRA